MLKFQKFAMVTASAAALLAAAGSAHALVFATVSGANVGFVSDASPPHEGGAFTGNGKDVFSFLVAGLPTNLTSELVFNSVTTTEQPTAVTSGATVTYTLTGFAGTFTDIYEGATKTVDGVHLVSGVTDLLTGTITDGTLVGSTISGVSQNGTIDFTVTNYSSPYIMGIPAGGADFTLQLKTKNSHWSINKYGDLNTIQFTGAGGFVSVPEPAAWSLMLLGVGGIGAAMRRRRGAVAAA